MSTQKPVATLFRADKNWKQPSVSVGESINNG